MRAIAPRSPLRASGPPTAVACLQPRLLSWYMYHLSMSIRLLGVHDGHERHTHRADPTEPTCGRPQHDPYEFIDSEIGLCGHQMSDSYLQAVSARHADSIMLLCLAELSLMEDNLEQVLVHSDLLARLRAACVCKHWHTVARLKTVACPAIVGRSMLDRRMNFTALTCCCERFLGSWTTHLDLSGFKRVQVAALLMTVLFHDGYPQTSRLPNLRSLDLSACEINDSVFAHIAECCPRLVELKVWACFSSSDDEDEDEDFNFGSLSDVGMNYLTQKTTSADTRSYNDYMKREIARAIEEQPELTHREAFRLAARRWHLSPARGICAHLEVVDLRACGRISGVGVARLASACPRLRELRLKGLAKIDDATLHTLGDSCPRLTTLDVSGGRVSDDGVLALAHGCGLLEVLFLAGCKRVGNVGVAALAAACSSLRILDLQGCATVGDDAALALAAHCRQLETISFQCCSRLSDVGFLRLITACPRLRHVTLKLCAVTRAAIDSVRLHHPQLMVLDHTEHARAAPRCAR